MTLNKNKLAATCLVCDSKKIYYDFSLLQTYRVEECANCGFMRVNPQPSDEELNKIYSDNYFLNSDEKNTPPYLVALKSSTAENYLNLLEKYNAPLPLTGSLLQIGCGHGEFLTKAMSKGLKVTGVEYSEQASKIAAAKVAPEGRVLSGDISQLLNSGKQFDYIVFTDVLENIRNPRDFLNNIHTLLNPNGSLLITVPSLDSFSARVMKRKWTEFKIDRLWYFSTNTLKRLLYSENFKQLKTMPAKKTVNVHYIAKHFKENPVEPFTKTVKLIEKILPKSLQEMSFNMATHSVLAFAKKAEFSATKKLSIIMAVFNEATTAKLTIDQVLAKKIPGIDIELIIVESASTDGTQEIIRTYENHERVTIIWQDKPRGKGNAIRAGFEKITGDFVLIQDSDDEYDIDDYNVLLEPLMTGEADFVLGARHGGKAWKMRQFNDQIIMGHFLNFGHWFFTTLVNVFFGTRLKDPFTMYKVFRADCLNGLTFECDRFDFDFELLIKLVRNGYNPIEIPVNYRSRSFKEGKKVQIFRDPITWFKAILKFRLQKM